MGYQQKYGFFVGISGSQKSEYQQRARQAGVTRGPAPGADVAMSAVDGRASWPLLGPRRSGIELQHCPVYTVDDLHMLKLAALQSIGMTALPDYMCIDEIRQELLVPVLPGWTPPTINVLAVFPSRRGMVPAVRRFLDFLGDNILSERIATQVT